MSHILVSTSDKLINTLTKIGYEIIDGGCYAFSEWSASMTEAIKLNLQNFLDLSDEDIQKIIDELWHTDYSVSADTKTLEQWAETLKKNATIYKEGVAKIDQLFALIKHYRSSSFFKSLLNFTINFKDLSPYNSMLVKTQMPEARYVLTAKQWRERYSRRPKDEARPLVVLRKYGPISFVFEIGDTIPMQRSFFNDDIQAILDQVANPYAVNNGKVAPVDYENLIRRLAYNGIKEEKFRVGASYGAMIRKSVDKTNIKVYDRDNDIHDVEINTYYKIFVNERADKSEEFASVCHELGHLFCHHLTPISPETWKLRNIPTEQKEFEAECVSYLVCGRHGVENRSWTYLSGWLDNNEEIPQMSLERVFRAADTIESMLGEQDEECTKGLLYHYDNNYKKKIDTIIANK